MKKLTEFFQKIPKKGLSSLLMLSVVFAQEINLKPTEEFGGLVNITIPAMVPVIIQVILIVAALVALIFLIIGGIKWITAGGDKAATESARGTITSALIGLVIVFASWAIIRLIELFFNISILTLTLPEIEPEPYGG